MKHTRKKNNGMTKHRFILPVFLVAVVVLVVGAAATELSAWHWPSLIKYEDAEFFTELNYTDKDIGVQAFVDGEAWKWLKIVAPNGRIFYVEAKGNLSEIGLTELRFESDEPQFADTEDGEADLTLEEFLEMFPEGRYRFYGCTVEGDFLRGKARFSHDIPCAPNITSPAEDDGTLKPKDVVISWDNVTNMLNNETGECGANPIEVVGYQVIVEFEDEETGRVLEFLINLPGNATEVTVPEEYFERIEADPDLDGEYKAEVLAIAANGNRTITEREFELKD